jgi:hypothetical protein
MLSDKQQAIELLDQLGPSQLAAVVHLLEVMLDEDDTLSVSECKAVAEAEEWLKHNEPIPHEQVLSEMGLSIEDWERMCNEPLPGETRS